MQKPEQRRASKKNAIIKVIIINAIMIQIRLYDKNSTLKNRELVRWLSG